MKSFFEKGENVRIIGTGKIGTVNELLPRNAGYAYRVTVDGKTSAYPEKYLEKYIDEEQEIIETYTLEEFGNIDDFRLFQTWYRLKRPVEGNYYSYLSSRTVFNPFQFKPLSKFIESGSEDRLFIADEVGVGKTIEAGIILTELVARGRIDRRSCVLVICPNSLGMKWVKEMKDRFSFQFHLHDSSSLKNYLRAVKEGNIPEGMSWSIVSLTLLRSKNHLKNLEQIASSRVDSIFSMVIIDESHHMRNPSTDNYRVGSTISSISEMMIMLSATPLNLRDADRYNQMHILNPSIFPDYETFAEILSPVKAINKSRRLLTGNDPAVFSDILTEIQMMEQGPLGYAITSHPGVRELKKRLITHIPLNNDEIARFNRVLISLSPLDRTYTRTLKREALEHRVTREPIKVPITLSYREQAFFDDVLETTKRAYLERGGEACALGFVLNVPARMVTSCIPAMKDYLAWCVKFGKEEINSGSPTEKEDFDDDQSFGIAEISPCLKSEYQRLLAEAEELEATDSKYAEFSELIKRLMDSLENKQIIVFSFFIRTLKYLEKRLKSEGYCVGIIYGDVPARPGEGERSRYDIIEDFEKGQYDILLSSEVGGEGLDFQFCQAIVNYDLPYNPMRIEQRIGRIDRFGQKSDKVFVASMFLKGTVDEDIYTALYDRIHLIEDSVGSLEPILGTELADLRDDIINGKLSPEQQRIRIDEIQQGVENAKLEQEQFEKDRYEYLGEDYFTSLIQNIGKKTGYIQPVDALWLTEYCFSLWESCSFEALDENRARITLSKDVLQDLERYTRLPGSEGSMNELGPLLKGRYPKDVIVNGSVAVEHMQAIFLPPSGFWIRFLLGKVEREQKMNRVCLLSANHTEINLSPGWYCAPVFEIRIEGFTKELGLAIVPVSLADNKPSPVDGRDFSRRLMSVAKTNSVHDDYGPIGDIHSIIDVGRSMLEKQTEGELEDLRTENDYRIHTRIQSIKRATEVQIKNIDQQIEKHMENRLNEGQEPNEPYLKMKRGQRENLLIRADMMTDDLEKRRNLSFMIQLIGIILIEVVE